MADRNRNGGAMNTTGFSAMMTNPPDMNVRTELSDFMTFMDSLKAGPVQMTSNPNGPDGLHLHSAAQAELVRNQVGLFPTLVLYRTFFGNDRFLSTVCAPLSLSDALTYRGFVKEYEPGLPQKVSERGPVRSGRWTESQFAMQLEYYGIGLRMTYQQMQTPQGPEMLNMARNRMVDSFLDMFNASVLRAYLDCNDAAFDEEIANGQDSWNDPTLQAAQDRERLFFDIVHRLDFSMQKLSDEIAKQQKKYGGTGNVLIVHPDIRPAIKYKAVNTLFYLGGQDALANLNRPADQSLQSLDGLPIYTVPDKSAYNTDMCQLLVNRAISGQYHLVKPRWDACGGGDLADCDLWTTTIYDADADQGVQVGLDYALDACPIWDPATGKLIDINTLPADGQFAEPEQRFPSTHYWDDIKQRTVPASYYGQLQPEFFRTSTLLKFAQRIGRKVLGGFGVESSKVAEHLNVLEDAVATIERIQVDANVNAFVGGLLKLPMEFADASAFRGLSPSAGVNSVKANAWGGLNLVYDGLKKDVCTRWQLPPLYGNYAGLRTIAEAAGSDEFKQSGFNVLKAQRLPEALETFDRLTNLLASYLPGNFLTDRRYASSWWQNADDRHTLFENTLGRNRAPVFITTADGNTSQFQNEVLEAIIATGDAAAQHVQANITGQLRRLGPDAAEDESTRRIGAEFAAGNVVRQSVVYTGAPLPALASPAFDAANSGAGRPYLAAIPAGLSDDAKALREQINRVVGIMFNYRFIPTGRYTPDTIAQKINSEAQRALVLSFLSHLQLEQNASAVKDNARKLKAALDWLATLDGNAAASGSSITLARAMNISGAPSDNSLGLAPLPRLEQIKESMRNAPSGVQTRDGKDIPLPVYLYGASTSQLSAALAQISANKERAHELVKAPSLDDNIQPSLMACVRTPLTFAPEQVATWTARDIVPANIYAPDMPMNSMQRSAIAQDVRRNQSRLAAAETVLAITNVVRHNLATGAESGHTELAQRILAATAEASALSTATSTAMTVDVAIDPAVSSVLHSRGFVMRWAELQRMREQPLERLIAMVYMATPTDRDTALALAASKIGVPYAFLLFQPRIRFTTVDALKVQTGAETAEQKMAYPLAYYGQESQTQEFHAGLKLWHGVIVKQPINVYRVRNCMITGYQGGFNLLPFRFEEWQPDLRRMDESKCSVFVVLEPIDGAPYSPRISIYGKHEETLPGYVAQPGRNAALHYQNAAMANQLWQFRQLRGQVNVGGDSRLTGEPLAYCWRGPSFPINVKSGKFDQIVTSAGYLNTVNQTHGLRKVWDGEMTEYPKMDISQFTPVL